MHELLERFKHDTRLPTIKGEQCVHALMENASCRGCAEVCPKDAWLLDDDSLSLDVDACDGCGLCVPVCPEGAISIHGYSIALREASIDIQQQLNAFCACEFAAQNISEGVVPCIHALKLQDILKLVNKGVSQLTLTTANCCHCERDGKNNLFDMISLLNNALQATGYQGIEVKSHTPNEWHRLLNQESAATGPNFSRRNFFRALVSSGVEKKINIPDLIVLDESAFIPPGRLMPDGHEKSIWPFLPVLDAALCNGCDACVRLCPHEAIFCEEVEGVSSYRIHPQDCTGCNVCVDVCDSSAIKIEQWQTALIEEIRLAEQKCRACGNPFHIPVDFENKDQDGLCRICSKHNHYKNLHQVLTD